jgi:hypothetical protein
MLVLDDDEDETRTSVLVDSVSSSSSIKMG